MTHLDLDNALREPSFICHSIDTKKIAGRAAHERVFRDLVSQRPKLLWVRFGGCNSAAGSSLERRLAWHVHRLVSEQLAAGREVVIEGGMQLSSWNLEGEVAS
eukprot:9104468-Heterocapsa_arctica.AAC.1